MLFYLILIVSETNFSNIDGDCKTYFLFFLFHFFIIILYLFGKQDASQSTENAKKKYTPESP